MTHAPDELLAALALGETDVDPAVRDHVGGCPVCSEELSELAHVHQMLREETGTPAPHRDLPGPDVWARIVAETSATGPFRPGDVDGPPVVSSTPDETHTATVLVPIEQGRRSGRHEGSTTRRRVPWLVAAAAACLLVGALVSRAVWQPSEPSATVVASVALTTLDASRQQEGTAQLVDTRGVTELRVDTRPMSVSSGFVEVWLINTDLKRMVSIGVLSSSQAVFPVPADAIGQGYTIVDLSHEQYDDRPQHSGDSLMRGTLPA